MPGADNHPGHDGVSKSKIAAVILLKFLPALAAVAVADGLVRISLLFRAHAMRAFAARWGLQYIGPPLFTWGFARGRVAHIAED